jgi:hypothetical protein
MAQVEEGLPSMLEAPDSTTILKKKKKDEGGFHNKHMVIQTYLEVIYSFLICPSLCLLQSDKNVQIF